MRGNPQTEQKPRRCHRAAAAAFLHVTCDSQISGHSENPAVQSRAGDFRQRRRCCARRTVRPEKPVNDGTGRLWTVGLHQPMLSSAKHYRTLLVERGFGVVRDPDGGDGSRAPGASTNPVQIQERSPFLFPVISDRQTWSCRDLKTRPGKCRRRRANILRSGRRCVSRRHCIRCHA